MKKKSKNFVLPPRTALLDKQYKNLVISLILSFGTPLQTKLIKINERIFSGGKMRLGIQMAIVSKKSGMFL